MSKISFVSLLSDHIMHNDVVIIHRFTPDDLSNFMTLFGAKYKDTPGCSPCSEYGN